MCVPQDFHVDNIVLNMLITFEHVDNIVALEIHISLSNMIGLSLKDMIGVT